MSANFWRQGWEHVDKSVGINIFCWSIFKTIHDSMCANFWGWLDENDDGYTFMCFTHFLIRIGMGTIIFLGVCLQTCYIFVVDPLANGCRDGSMGIWVWRWSLNRILYFIDYSVKLLFFWWSVSQQFFSNLWLQYLFFDVIKFLIFHDYLIHRKHFWIDPAKTGY